MARPTLLTLVALGFFARQGFAVELHGVVRENDEENGRPLPGVEVEAPGASQTRTGSEGRFTLSFPERRAGDTITVEVGSPGFVVVNDLDLDLVRLPSPGQPELPIVLSRPEDKEVMARRMYRRRVVAALDAEHQRKLQTLKAEKLDRDVYRLRAKLVDAHRDLLLGSALTMAAELANDNVPGSVAVRGRALALFSEGKFVEAMGALDLIELATMSEALAMKEKDMATALYQLGVKHATQKRFGQASKALAEAVAIHHQLTSSGSPDQPELAAALEELAQSYLAQDRAEDARKVLEEALALRHRMSTYYVGEKLPLVKTLDALARVYQLQDRLEDAGHALEEKLVLCRDLMTCNACVYSSWVADTQIELGGVREKQNRLYEARRGYQEARAISSRGNEECDHLNLTLTLYHLAALEIAASQTDEGNENLDAVADALAALATAFREQGQFQKAERAVKIRNEVDGKNPDVARIRRALRALAP
jgi:tetratricopeptide (TPR) repeat protein